MVRLVQMPHWFMNATNQTTMKKGRGRAGEYLHSNANSNMPPFRPQLIISSPLPRRIKKHIFICIFGRVNVLANLHLWTENFLPSVASTVWWAPQHQLHWPVSYCRHRRLIECPLNNREVELPGVSSVTAQASIDLLASSHCVIVPVCWSSWMKHCSPFLLSEFAKSRLFKFSLQLIPLNKYTNVNLVSACISQLFDAAAASEAATQWIKRGSSLFIETWNTIVGKITIL